MREHYCNNCERILKQNEELRAEQLGHLRLIEGLTEQLESARAEAKANLLLSGTRFNEVQRLKNEREVDIQAIRGLSEALFKVSLGHQYGCGTNDGLRCTCVANIAKEALEKWGEKK
jgi:hypothetical protein